MLVVCVGHVSSQFGDEVTSRIGKEPEEIFSETRATDVYVCWPETQLKNLLMLGITVTPFNYS